ncbi:MAG: hypothetical protein NTV23_06015 [Propionibacteriales bacterium]|nr:hypothetical protein [Propionibacteriales bacterium]
MRFRLGAVGLLGVALALGSVPDAVEPAALNLEPGPRVMVVGDSVAHQFDGDYTWRYRLAMEFKRQQAPVNFVGPFNWAYGEANNYLVHGWDSQHDAQGATTIKNYLHLPPTPEDPGRGRLDIVPTMRTYLPDVIVAVMANNDLNNGLAGTRYGIPSIRDGLHYFGRAWAEPKVDQVITDVLAEYSTFVTAVRSVNPDVKIVIAEITSQLVPGWIRDRFNAALVTRIPSTATSPVTVAPTDDARWSQPGFTVDGVHTTPTGDLLMAQRIALGIRALPDPPLPRTPAIPQMTVPWTPALIPNVRTTRHRIYLNWARPARANTVLGVRVELVDVRTGTVTRGDFEKSPTWYSAVLRPGDYRVRIQGVRVTMRTPWSPWYDARIPPRPST